MAGDGRHVIPGATNETDNMKRTKAKTSNDGARTEETAVMTMMKSAGALIDVAALENGLDTIESMGQDCL